MKIIKIICSIILFIFVIFSITLYLLYNGNPIKKYEYQQSFNKYLSDKYLGVFKIEQIQYDFKQDLYYVKAYPLNDETLEFTIKKSKNEMFDDYLQNKWIDEIKKEVNPIIEKELNNIPKKVSIDIIGQPYNYNVKTEIPKFNDVKDLFSKESDGVVINIILNNKLAIDNEKEEYTKIFNIVNDLRNMQLYPRMIDILYDMNQTHISINKNDFGKINKVQDIAKYKI